MIGDTSKHTTREKRRIGSVINRPIEVLPYEKGDNKDLTLTFKARNFNNRELTVKPDEYIDNKPLGYKFKEIDYQEIINIDLSKTPFIKILLKGDLNIDNIINQLNYSEYVIIFVQNNIGNYNVTMNDENINFYLNNNASLGDINKNPNGVTILKYKSINDVFYGELNSLNEEDYQERIYKPFIFTIDTTKGSGSSFNLPLRTGYNYDMLVDWGDGETSEVKSFDDINKTHTYATGGEYQIKISGLCEAWYFNNGGDKLKITSIDQWGYTSFINMDGAFRGCTNLTTAGDGDGNWCRNVVSMRTMFFDCTSLTTLNVANWNTSNITTMSGMFYNCTSLIDLDVSNWNVSNVTNISYMFFSCSSLENIDVSNWDVSKVNDMAGLFNNCTSLTSLDLSNWNVSNVTNIDFIFRNCTSLINLDLSNWNVSNVTSMSTIFSLSTSLKTINISNWNTSNVVDMQFMFASINNDMSLENIIGIENLDVSNVTNMFSMFQRCTNLTNFDISKWNVSNVTNMNGIFANAIIDTSSYDALLIGWSQLPSLQPNLTFIANLIKYSAGAAANARQYIIDTYGWTISDGGQV